jgi:hypothetical protein
MLSTPIGLIRREISIRKEIREKDYSGEVYAKKSFIFDAGAGLVVPGVLSQLLLRVACRQRIIGLFRSGDERNENRGEASRARADPPDRYSGNDGTVRALSRRMRVDCPHCWPSAHERRINQRLAALV